MVNVTLLKGTKVQDDDLAKEENSEGQTRGSRKYLERSRDPRSCQSTPSSRRHAIRIAGRRRSVPS